MLRDLDNRDYSKTFSVKNANYVPPSSSKVLWGIIGCLSIFCVVAASYSVYLVNQPPTISPAQEISESVDVEKGDQYSQKVNIPAKQNELSDLQQSPQITTAINTQQPDEVSAFIPNQASAPLLQLATAVTVVSKDTTSETTVAQVSHFDVKPSDGSKAQLSTLRAKAHIASEQKNDAEVIRLLKKILFVEPLETKTRKQLAALLFSTNQLNEAQQILAQGIKQKPADSSLRLMQSRIFFKLGDNNSAFTVLSMHPYSALANDELVSFRAALAEKIGKYGNAQKDYQILVQRNPTDAKWWLGLGVSQDKQKLNKQAINSYQQAQSLNQLPQPVDSFVAERIQLLTRSS
ncbi:MAG: MSHA biogenesis protein MshN [Alphaproteobacteria bacterium]|jgi:MSHA biogenesis protein MshN